jgi:hypothetical protein
MAFVCLFNGIVMTIRRQHWIAGGAALLPSLTLLFLLSCLPLANIEPVEPFGMTNAGPDTIISPYGPLCIRFSYPVLDTNSVRFVFQPLFTEFRQAFNATHDTVTIEFILPLQGDEQYTLFLASPVESEDGSVLRPGEDSLVLVTFPTEQEPNDFVNIADTLRDIAFGSVSAANDTDWFAIQDTSAGSFYLKSTGSSSLFKICDADSLSVRPQTFAAAETLDIPGSFERPLHIAVFAFNRSNGGHYELGVVEK